MQHCDDDTLSLLALGEPVHDDAAGHIAGCARCRAELESLRTVVNGVRPDAAGARPVAPPPRVWDAIASATGVSAKPRPDRVLAHAGPEGAVEDAISASPPAGVPADAPTPPAGLITEPPPVGPPPVGPPPVEPPSVEPPSVEPPSVEPPSVEPPIALSSRRQQRPARPAARRLLGSLPVLAAAAALVVGVVTGVAGTLLLRDDRPSPSPSAGQVLSSTPLAALEAAPTASGRADVVQSATGRRLELDVARLEAADGFYQVWLINPDVTRMVPVGVLRGSRGDFVLPDGVDLEKYPVVDVSVEPLDGDPRHSGTSVLRGTIKG